MKKGVLKYLKYLLLIIFINYYADISFFYHTHTFSWGIVSHSHPYLPYSHHTHTQQTCIAIYYLDLIEAVELSLIALTSLFLLIRIIYNNLNYRVVAIKRHLKNLRAPPFSLA